jgi:hypothetical protein
VNLHQPTEGIDIMLTIVLTAAVCVNPIPLGATQAEIEAADCNFATKAYTSSHAQCTAVRDAFMHSIGNVRFYGYMLCAWDKPEVDPEANYINLPRVSFNKKVGI